MSLFDEKWIVKNFLKLFLLKMAKTGVQIKKYVLNNMEGIKKI